MNTDPRKLDYDATMVLKFLMQRYLAINCISKYLINVIFIFYSKLLVIDLLSVICNNFQNLVSFAVGQRCYERLKRNIMISFIVISNVRHKIEMSHFSLDPYFVHMTFSIYLK